MAEPEPEPAPGPRLLFALITAGRHDSALAHVVSLLHALQREHALGLDPVFQFFDTADAALNAMHADPACAACLLVDSDKAFPHDFLLRALACPHDLVLGVYPVSHGEMDWAGVRARAVSGGGELLRHAANPAYSVLLEAPGEAGPATEYARALEGGLGVALVKREVVERVAAAFPGRAHDQGVDFALEGVVAGGGGGGSGSGSGSGGGGGALLGPGQKLCAAWRACGGAPVADLERPCRAFGPATFAGCVGLRVQATGDVR